MSCLELGYKRCITSHDVVFKTAEMAFKKSNNAGRNAEISEEELEHEEILVEMVHNDAELHNPYEVKEEAHDA